MWVTGSKNFCSGRAPVMCSGKKYRVNRGFTLIEILVAISIVAMVLAVSVPSSIKFYQSIQYRQAVRTVEAILTSARHGAITSGRPSSVLINPYNNRLIYSEKVEQLPAALTIAVRSAAELNREDLAVIRFYPEGGSSGGEIDITRPGGAGVTLLVDWLIGRITQQRYGIRQDAS